MSSGFQSNYNDSGYTVSNSYDHNNNLITTIPSRDIYLNTQQVGVYMLNGSRGGSVTIYPIYCSLGNMTWAGLPLVDDDAWLVYPGFGFQLFGDVNYVAQLSRLYINTSTVPVLFSFATGGFTGRGTMIKNNNGDDVDSNLTKSVRLYFRGEQININHLS